MDQLDEQSVHGRVGVIIGGLVVGLAVLGAGGYLAWSKRQGGAGSVVSEEVGRWCAIREEWARQADPLAGDIMLKSVRDADRAEMEQLTLKRNKLCAEQGRRIAELKVQ